MVFPAKLRSQGLGHMKVSLMRSELVYFARDHGWSNTTALSNPVLSSSVTIIFT